MFISAVVLFLLANIGASPAIFEVDEICHGATILKIPHFFLNLNFSAGSSDNMDFAAIFRCI